MSSWLLYIWTICTLSISIVYCSGDSSCDLQVIDALEATTEGVSSLSSSLDWEKPFLLRNFLRNWPLDDNFLELYGHLKVQIGSESSIVHSHGSADAFMLLKEFVNVSKSLHSRTENLSFDSNILRRNPELWKKYSTPDILKSQFEGDLNFPVLSVGVADTGLPLHTHGSAYLGLIEGSKQWLLYRPGSRPPRDPHADSSPFLPMDNWFRGGNVRHSDKSGLFCTQHVGDIVYVPAGWPHATYNISPRMQLDDSSYSANSGANNYIVVGVGMQNTWLADDREAFSREVLNRNPSDYDAIMGVVTSIFHKEFEPKLLTVEKTNPIYAYSSIESKEAILEAISLLKQAITIRPNYPDARNMLVVTLFRLGDVYFEEALVEAIKFEEMLDILSSEWEYYINNKDHISTSKFDSQFVLPSRRGLSSAYYRLSLPLSSAGFEDKAINLLEKSIKLDNGNPKAHAQRVFLKLQRGKYSEAQLAMEEMRFLTPDDDTRGQDLLRKMEAIISINLKNQSIIES